MAFALNLGTLNVTIGANDSALRNALSRSIAGMQRAGQRMRQIGTRMSLALTAPITGFGIASIKAFADFEDAMVKSTSIMGNVSADLRKEMEQAALTMSQRTVTSAQELAKSYFFLASAGLSAEQSLAALDKVNQFAIAGNFEMARATDLLTDAQSALGLTIRDNTAKNMENMVRLSDVLVKANTLANATVEQFSRSLTTKAGAALRQLNKDAEEGVAVLAAMADQGVKGELAGERLSIVLRDLQRASVNNTAAWEKMNLQVFDAQGNVRNLASIIKQLEGLLTGMSDKQKQVTLTMLGFQFRSISAIKSLLGTSDAIALYETKLRDAAGITDEVANKQMKSFSAQMRIVMNNVTAMGIQIGRILAPFLARLNQMVLKATVFFKGLTETQQILAVGMVGLVAAAGPLMIIFGFFVSTVATLIGGVVTLVTSFLPLIATLGAVATGLGLIIAKLIGPESVTSAFDSAIGSALGFLKEVVGVNDDTLRTFNKTFQGIKLGFSGIMLAGTLVWDGMLVAVKSVAGAIVLAFGKAFAFVKSGFGQLEKTIGTAILGIGENLRNVPGFGDQAKSLRDFGSALRTVGQRDIASGRDNVLVKTAESIFKSAEQNAVNIQEAGANFNKSLGDFFAADRIGQFIKESPIAKKDVTIEGIKKALAPALTKDKAIAEIKTPKVTVPKFDLPEIKVPDFNIDSPVANISAGVAQQDFQSVSLRRFDIKSAKPFQLKREEVRAPGVEDKLDTLIDVTKARSSVAILG